MVSQAQWCVPGGQVKSCTSAWGGRTAREEVLALPFASTFLGHCIIEKVSYDGRSNLIFPITSTFKYKTSNDTQRTNQIPVGQKLKGGGYYDHVILAHWKHYQWPRIPWQPGTQTGYCHLRMPWIAPTSDPQPSRVRPNSGPKSGASEAAPVQPTWNQAHTRNETILPTTLYPIQERKH